MTPALSVVLPTYNRLRLLQQTLPTVLDQQLDAPFELVIVVDGSTDGTAAWLAELRPSCDLRVLVQANRGQAAALNAGLREATGRYVLFLDDDLLCPPGLLQAHLDAHEHPNSPATSGRANRDARPQAEFDAREPMNASTIGGLTSQDSRLHADVDSPARMNAPAIDRPASQDSRLQARFDADERMHAPAIGGPASRDNRLHAHLDLHEGTGGYVVLGPVVVAGCSPRGLARAWAEREAAELEARIASGAPPAWPFDTIVSANTSVPRRALEAAGGFDERMRVRGFDADLGLRLHQAGLIFRWQSAARCEQIYVKSAGHLLRHDSQAHAQAELLLARHHPEYRPRSFPTCIVAGSPVRQLARRLAASPPASSGLNALIALLDRAPSPTSSLQKAPPTSAAVGESIAEPVFASADAYVAPRAAGMARAPTAGAPVGVARASLAAPPLGMVRGSAGAPSAGIPGDSSGTPSPGIPGDSSRTPSAGIPGDSSGTPSACIARDSSRTPSPGIPGDSSAAPSACIARDYKAAASGPSAPGAREAACSSGLIPLAFGPRLMQLAYDAAMLRASAREAGGWRGLRREFGVRLPVLLYHRVGPPVAGEYVPNTISPEQFSRQVRWLRRKGYQAINPDMWLAWRRGEGQVPAKPVLITFDDAYADLSDHALPLLHDIGWSATVFAVSGEIGGTNRWDQAKGWAKLPLMTAADVRFWSERGIAFGAHGRTHADLVRLTPLEATDEIAGSKADLEALTGHRVAAFAYPYGHWTPALRDLAAKHFDLAFTTDEALASIRSDPLALPRLAIEAQHSLFDFALQVRLGSGLGRQLPRPLRVPAARLGTLRETHWARDPRPQTRDPRPETRPC